MLLTTSLQRDLLAYLSLVGIAPPDSDDMSVPVDKLRQLSAVSAKTAFKALPVGIFPSIWKERDRIAAVAATIENRLRGQLLTIEVKS